MQLQKFEVNVYNRYETKKSVHVIAYTERGALAEARKFLDSISEKYTMLAINKGGK